MSEQLSPEQRARIILDGGPLTLGYDDWQHYQRAIAAAIRAAETAAVEAERERCAETAFEGQKGMSCFVKVEDCAAYNRGRRDAAEDIRRTPATEADNAR